MSGDLGQSISIACEGLLDRTILERLVAAHDLDIGPVYEMGGKQRLLSRLRGYVNAARFAPWVVQCDLDDDGDCAPELARRLVADPPPGLCLIIAVRQTELWLLADRRGISAHLRIGEAHVTESPEELGDAKAALVDLARRSRNRDVREDVVPAIGSGRRVGSGYTARMQAFVNQEWDFRRAAVTAPSLARLIGRMQQFARTGGWWDDR